MEKIDVETYVSILKQHKHRIEKTELNFVVQCAEKNAYEKIIYKYPSKNYIATLIRYYEEKEDYERCQEIVNFVVIHNSLNNSNVKTKL